jgi:outer membrane lipoprotein-sorting protein
MVRKINNTGVKVMVVAVVMLGLAVTKGLTEDWSKILDEAKAKYIKFEEAVKDMTIVQEMKVVIPEGEIPSEMRMLRKGKKFRMETEMQMPQVPKEMGVTQTIIIYDGKDIWMISSLMGKKKLSDEEDKNYQREMDWWDVISEKAEIVGTEKIGDRECYVVSILEPKDSPFTRIWVDKKNLVLVQAESKEPEGETILLVNSDFKKIKDDWEWPYKTEISSGGKLMTTMIVKSLEINTGLSDDLFNPENAKVKGFSMQDMMQKMMEKEGK